MTWLMKIFETIDNRNTTNDFGEVILYANDITDGILIKGILLMFFFITFLGSYFSSIRLRGRGDIVASFATAGFVTFGLSLIFSVRDGLLQLDSILISLVVAIIGFVWLILDKK